MASPQTELLASPQTELLAQVVQVLKSVQGELTSMNHSMNVLATKTSIMELRQSSVIGEGTDAVRHADQWAKGESAQLSDKAVEFMKTRIESADDNRKLEVCTYSDLFLQKDTRRGQYELICFFKVVVEEEVEFYNKGDEYCQGWVGILLPELRKILQAKNIKLPDTPVALEAMLKLSLPLDKCSRPFKQAAVSGWMAPKKCTTSEDLSPEEINELMNKIPKKIKDLLDQMPKEENEDPRVTLMHAAIYFNLYHSRYHEQRKTGPGIGFSMANTSGENVLLNFSHQLYFQIVFQSLVFMCIFLRDSNIHETKATSGKLTKPQLFSYG